jgi:hypothetical protein
MFWQILSILVSVLAATLAILLATKTFLLAKKQLTVMNQQLEIMARQLEIMGKQDELLARRAKLELLAEYKPSQHNDGSLRDHEFTFSVHNSGSKTAANYYWHLLLPRDVFGEVPLKLNLKRDVGLMCEPLERGGILYSYYRNSTIEPIYPTRHKLIGTITIGTIAAKQTVKILWSLVAEDGKFPPDTDFATLELKL